MRARSLIAVAAALAVLLAAPVAAQAAEDLSLTLRPSATVVPKGGAVTMTVTVKNEGTEPPFMGVVLVELFSLSGHGQPADNPVQSIEASQGSCSAGEAVTYHEQICSLGSLDPGASATIVEVVQV